MRYIMKSTILWVIAVLSLSTAFAQSQASTFQNPVKGELYSEERQPELYCMAMNIYFEARAEPLAGQYAVADVVLNRVQDTRYPDTICEVIKDGPIRESWKTRKDPDLSDSERIYFPIKNRCQFSWYCDGRADIVYDNDAWRIAQEIAFRVVNERRMRGLTEGSTHYHADYVSPKWAKELDLVGRVGTHIFYRWP